MDFTTQLITPEGENWEIDEKFTNDKGILEVRKVPLTYFKVARESLLGKVGSRILNSIFVTKWRWTVFLKIDTGLRLNYFDKLLIKKLVSMRFDISIAAQLINALDTQ